MDALSRRREARRQAVGMQLLDGVERPGDSGLVFPSLERELVHPCYRSFHYSHTRWLLHKEIYTPCTI
jgi:hypothetical protein